MEDIFKFKNLTYNFRNAELSTLNKSNVNSVKYGTETITSLGAKIWKILPNGYKQLTSLSTFKLKIKNWETGKCSCSFGKTYIQQIGFVWPGLVTSDQCLLNIILFVCCCCCFVPISNKVLIIIIIIIIIINFISFSKIVEASKLNLKGGGTSCIFSETCKNFINQPAC